MAHDEEINTNCLEGMACPSCKSKGDFRIWVSGDALVSDDGIADIENLEWDDDSSCACRECTYGGTVSGFKAAIAKAKGRNEP